MDYRDHPQEDFAKFGKRSNKKVEFCFKPCNITYGLNMVNSTFFCLEIRKLKALFHPPKKKSIIYLFIYLNFLGLSCGENSLQNNPNTRVGLILTTVSIVEHTNGSSYGVQEWFLPWYV